MYTRRERVNAIAAKALCFVSEHQGETGRTDLAIGGASRKYCHMIGNIVIPPRDKALRGHVETRL